MSQKKDVLVVGGGIIGVSCALELAKKGAQVTVLEKDKMGHGCSYGNAGWMTPCFALPLPMPGMLLQSMKWLMNPNSPLYIKPSLNPLLFKWLILFVNSMTEKKAHQSAESLIALSQKSLKLYKELNEKYPNEFGFQQKGLLMVSQTDSGMESIMTELRLVAKYGVPGKELSEADVKKMEPAIIGNLRGGVHFPNEAHAEPLAVVSTIKKAAEQLGVKFIDNCELQDFVFTNGKVEKIKTTQGEFNADVFVLATGSWTTELAKKVKTPAPIMGGKGYAMIFPKLSKQPQYPIMFLERKIAITPRENSLRVAGTLELVNQDFVLNQRRINVIKSGARLILDLPENAESTETWAGLRPCTPDGLPMIGFSSEYSNLVFAAGHQMLGLQSGIGSGNLVAEIIYGKSLTAQEKIFNPNRF